MKKMKNSHRFLMTAGFAAVVAGITILFFVGFMEDKLDTNGSIPIDTDEVPKGEPPKGE